MKYYSGIYKVTLLRTASIQHLLTGAEHSVVFLALIGSLLDEASCHVEWSLCVLSLYLTQEMPNVCISRVWLMVYLADG